MGKLLYIAKQSLLDSWRIIFLFNFSAGGPELHCKYTHYIIAHLEKEIFVEALANDHIAPHLK